MSCSSRLRGGDGVPTGFHTQQIKANGTTIHVRVGGHGPAVVLLHGFGDTGDMWAPLAAMLVEGPHRDRARPARHGALGPSRHRLHQGDEARDMPGCWTRWRSQKADLVTHDIGNMVGYALAAQYPGADHANGWRSTRRCPASATGTTS